MKSRFLSSSLFAFFLLACASVSAAQTKPVNVSGQWQISWEARIGTESDVIELKQNGSILNGTFHGRLGSPKVSGEVDGKNVTLRLDFPGEKPYSLVFTGAIETQENGGDKMSGKFEIPGVRGAYDFHGENVRPSNYTWSAVRMPEAAHASSSGGQQNPPGKAKYSSQ
jgi:hypothetical protein